MTLTSSAMIPPPSTKILPPLALRAILAHWDAPRYDGTQAVRIWLAKIGQGCETYGIADSGQRIETALHFMDGEARTVIKAIRDEKLKAEENWSWEKFQTDLTAIDTQYKSHLGTEPAHNGADSRPQHPFATTAYRIGMISTGAIAAAFGIVSSVLQGVGLILTTGGAATGSLANAAYSVFRGRRNGRN